jgi:hypothetical protein
MTEAISPAAKAAVLRRGAAARPMEIRVTGSSMGAAIPTGARVAVIAACRPRRGEVWAFVSEAGQVVVHRFRRRRDGVLWFQGDGNDRIDRPVTPEMLIGRVASLEVAGRRTKLGTRARVRGRLMLDVTALARRVDRIRCRPG